MNALVSPYECLGTHMLGNVVRDWLFFQKEFDEYMG